MTVEHLFVDYLKEIQMQFGKSIVFVDWATPNFYIITKRLRKIEKLRLYYLTAHCPEFNTVEECWRQGKYNILSCILHWRTFDFPKNAICNNCKTRLFNLDIVKDLVWSTN